MHEYLNKTPQVAQHMIKRDDEFPNNDSLPVLHYKSVFLPGNKNLCEDMENCFKENKWVNAWRNGIYEYHHYHSTAHEVLGVYSGQCKLQLGGPDGIIMELEEGDVLILPAGVAHKNVSSTPEFKCIGAYPEGQEYDMKYGKPEEQEEAERNIEKVPLPPTDPVLGSGGYLLEHWMIKATAAR